MRDAWRDAALEARAELVGRVYQRIVVADGAIVKVELTEAAKRHGFLEALPETVELADVGLKERSDVEEWVIKHPQILGSDVLIVTSEFAGWASKKGEKDLDRLDVLGLASDGHLVLA